MSMTDRRELEHPEAVYANDYVTVQGDASFDGVVVGLEPALREALVHEYTDDGYPTTRLHEVSVDNIIQHDEGRTP